jgi:hypothetical protein
MTVAHVTGLMRRLLAVIGEDQQFALFGGQLVQVVRCQDGIG